MASTPDPKDGDVRGGLFLARKVVRDLLWTVSSPHMISGALYPVLPASMGAETLLNARVVEWLTAFDADPQPLLSSLQDAAVPKSGNLALGVYFSALLEFWLRRCPAFRVERFATGTQIVSATNQTIGQLKFLFRCEIDSDEQQAPKKKEDMHVESSVKFFLLHPLRDRLGPDASLSQQQAVANGSGADRLQEHRTCFPLEQFVGPHLGENLAWRVQEVARKLDMCRGDSVRAWLSANYSEDVSSHIVLRGYLFYPLRLFASTSSVTRSHDWIHHRNTTASKPHTCSGNCQSSVNESLPPSHPGIASAHLSGWWTSDFETEVPTKVSANDPAQCGESRFVVLPKLHWLSPVIAVEETPSGSVFVDGEPALGVDRVEAMTLSELLVFARTYFENLVAAPPEAQARGAVVMPLLVAEIIRCRSVDQEFSTSIVRWKELSRGFILDLRCWDPVPLCSEPVRFRRASARVDTSTLGSSIERKYAGRNEWRHDGVVKPTEQELASRHETRLRVFPNPESVSPSELVTRLAVVLSREQKDVTHATLKASIKEVLLSRVDAGGESNGKVPNSGRTISATGEFVQQSISELVSKFHPPHGESSSKQTQRVGHLILDAFESIISSWTRSVRQMVPQGELATWTGLFFRVAVDRRRWDFLKLMLRALQLIRVGDAPTLSVDSLREQLDATLEQLLSQEQCRWNTVAVEAVGVFFPSAEDPECRRRAHRLFHRLVKQEDWPNAERLTVATRDPTLLRAIFEELARRNMTKAMKRLRKLCTALLDDTDAFGSQARRRTGLMDEPIVLPTRATGPAIDHSRSLEMAGLDLSLKRWEYVCSSAQLQDVVAYLLSLERDVQAQPEKEDRGKKTIVGLDCEWRPQFLQSGSTCRLSKYADGGDDEDASTTEPSTAEGVSVYQLAVGDRVFVIDVQVLGVAATAPLRVIWKRSSPFLLVGFCVSSDVKRLAQSFPELMASSAHSETEIRLVELKRFAAFRHVPVDKWGLSRLYVVCFGQGVDKKQQCSDWGSRPLSSSQLKYAAMDAHAVRNVALHLLAEMKLKGGEVAAFMRQFAVVNRPALSHCASDIQVLGKPHVHAALRDFGLESAVRFRTISKDLWNQSPRHENGLVVKSIAVVVKRAPSDVNSTATAPSYAVVVLQLDRIIDMAALATCMGSSSPDDVSVAGHQTLVRVFGYSRGCVGPIGLRQQAAIQVVVDKRLEREHRLLCGAGALDEVYSIAPDVLISTVGATAADISTSVD